MKARISLLATVSLFSLISCGGEGPTTSSRLQVVHDTVGDTVVVRTVSGSVWGAPASLVPEVSIGKAEGEDPHYLFGRVAGLAVGPNGVIYVVDQQADQVEAYSSDGSWLRTLGERGAGPGELNGPDGGIAILSDGRVLVRDPGNARIQVFGPDGGADAEWPVVRGRQYTSRPLWLDRQDNVYTEFALNPTDPVGEWRWALLRVGPDGRVRDTLVVPHSGYAPPELQARSDHGSSSGPVPFEATEVWALHPNGYFIHAVSTDYRIDLLRKGAPVLRIERAYEPVVVQRAEKDAKKEQITQSMSMTQPGWRWNGPPIPDHKPPFTRIFAGRNGRIWVQVSQQGVLKPNPSYDPTRPGSQRAWWTEPVAFDVFDADGSYLGRVNPPTDFTAFVTPVFRSDTVWAVTTDSLGVQRVVRYHVQHGGASQPRG
jgi:hypothetical protein